MLSFPSHDLLGYQTGLPSKTYTSIKWTYLNYIRFIFYVILGPVYQMEALHEKTEKNAGGFAKSLRLLRAPSHPRLWFSNLPKRGGENFRQRATLGASACRGKSIGGRKSGS